MLKQLGIRCIIYIDDILVLHQDRLALARSMVVALNLMLFSSVSAFSMPWLRLGHNFYEDIRPYG